MAVFSTMQNKLLKLRASEPREKPIHINSQCEECNSKLVMFDKFYQLEVDSTDEPLEDTIWYDEWVCPKCQDGIVMDWPKDEFVSVIREEVDNLKQNNQ